MKVVAVIPARWASVRFPGKPLALLAGKPVIVHVCQQTQKSKHVQRIIVATDDQRIVDAVTAAGFDARLTRADHVNGTSRIAEVAATLNADIIVNVQGDEPRIEPELIDLAIEALMKAGKSVPVSTVASPFMPGEDANDPNLVKVAVGAHGRALYFSRSCIPFHRVGATIAVEPLKHVGLYVYRREFLSIFVALAPTPLELTEQLEQLRILENGHSIAVAIGNARFHGVDTPQQLEKLEARSSQ
ncbi:MAG: 3-deoxy-manno-octulosonate cytidylyltransferase [Phycisphaerales bacterium]|nr:3-deoxy-manno-octulosonate cytidylyltransferase [Phycisphaerales bacterium]